MTSLNVSVLSNDNTDINRRIPEDLIEVPPEILSKVENVGDKNQQQSPGIVNKCGKWIRIYINKFGGLHEERPKRLPWQEYLWSFIGAFLGIASVAFFHYRLLEP